MREPAVPDSNGKQPRAGTGRPGLAAFRRAAQISSFSLLAFIIWNTKYPPGSFINPDFLFKLDPFVMLSASIAERVLLPGLALSAATLAVTAMFGRIFCGFICPLGAIMDFTSWIKKLVFKRPASEPEPSPFRHLKYIPLAAVMAAALFGHQFSWMIDPVTIFVRSFSMNVHPLANGAIDRSMEGLIKLSGYNESIDALYNAMRESILSQSSPSFPHSGTILAVFLAVLVLVFVKRRLWCRYLCPLGALLAIFARKTPYARTAEGCRENCRACRNDCRMNAIRGDGSYLPEECVLCFDCIGTCPWQKTSFGFRLPGPRAEKMTGGGTTMTRNRFLASASTLAICLMDCRAFAGAPEGLLRPPSSLPEEKFLNRCIRCGNCMKVCPTNFIHPADLSSGLSGIWSPRLNTAIGYCEYNCDLCGRVCPTGAIEAFLPATKWKKKIGMAEIDKSLCLPWAKGENCIVCEEHCPVPEKAVKLNKKTAGGVRLYLPRIDADLCIGCAICEFKCPVKPKKAVIIKPVGSRK
ncbi:MAG: 4Fe-4S binding protein [Spirochaetes bacterium]|jgi:polyferredoxin|nr:4Fe-4S binding protein [Spirochaetota bacterium]